METKLARITEIAKQKPKERFTALYHLLNTQLLCQSHQDLEAKKAPGIDRVTKKEYEQNLNQNIENLTKRLKSHGYRPQPARRTYIPKAGSKEMRPLGIPAYEDKIVQMGLKKILEAIYEQDFLKHSYGARPEKSCHDALKTLNKILMEGKINWVVDADIKGFFNNVSHQWMIKFIEHRIGDPNIKRLLTRMLKAGVMVNGEIEATDAGTPQGSIVSPVLANVYLHYVLDLWFDRVISKQCRGQTAIVRYVDDFICCFQYREDAENFYEALKERLAKFQLELAEDKTKIIEFGRFAATNRKERNLGKPETFDFLGFTHYCSTSKQGKFKVKRKTSKKKFCAKLKAINHWAKAVRNAMTTEEIFKRVKAILLGHYRYYGITDNFPMLQRFRYEIVKILYKWFNRRSQRRSFTIDKFKRYLKLNPLPNPKIYVNIMDL